MAVDILDYCRIVIYCGLIFLTQLPCVAMEAECVYHVGQAGGFRLLRSFKCEHGCCGTIDNQKCCEKQEEDGTWKVVAIVLVSFVAILMVILLSCWLLKKKNKKNVRVRERNNRNRGTPTTPIDHTEIFALSQMRLEQFPKPPPYSYIEPRHASNVHHETGIAGVSNDTPDVGSSQSHATRDVGSRQIHATSPMTEDGESSAYIHRERSGVSRLSLPPPYAP